MVAKDALESSLNADASAAALAATRQDFAPALRLHALAEAMFVFALAATRLIRSFHIAPSPCSTRRLENILHVKSKDDG